MLDSLGGPFAIVIAVPNNCSCTRLEHFIEQAHLCLEIGFHGAVIVEVIAAEIGERPSSYRHTFVAKLVQPMAGRFVSDMSHTFAREPAHIAEKRDDIGCRQASGNAFIRCCHTQRSNACRPLSAHTPDLAGHLNAGCLAVRAGHRDNMPRDRREKCCCQMGKGTARFRVGNVQCARNARFGSRNNCHGTRFNSRRNEILPVEFCTLEGTENRAGSHLSIVNRKAGYLCLLAFCQRDACRLCQRPQLHHFFSGTRRSMSDRSTSRVLSGRTPSSGPMRGTRRPTIGAAVQPAVR